MTPDLAAMVPDPVLVTWRDPATGARPSAQFRYRDLAAQFVGTLLCTDGVRPEWVRVEACRDAHPAGKGRP